MSLELKPFHETIVDAIYLAISSEEMTCLARLIKSTKIPKNHDEILKAWQFATKLMCCQTNDLGVPANLLEQKQLVEKEALSKNALQMLYIEVCNDYDFDDIIRFCLENNISIQSRNKRDMSIAVKISLDNLEKLVALPFKEAIVTSPTPTA